MTTSPLVCPLCQRNDLIRKVSTIYHEGITSGTIQEKNVFGATVAIDPVFSQTGLSRRLAPPLPPNYRPRAPSTTGARNVVVILLILMACPFLVFVPFLLVFIPITLGSNVTTSPVPPIHAPHFSPTQLWLGGGILVVIVAIIVALVWLRRQSGPTPRQLAAQARQARYLESAYHWDSAYYCFRDDVVFLPGSSQTVRPEQLSTLL